MVLEMVKSLLAEQFSVEEDSITVDTKFEDLGADSLDLVEMVMALEEEFDIQIDDEEVEKIATVGDVVNYITANAKE